MFEVSNFISGDVVGISEALRAGQLVLVECGLAEYSESEFLELVKKFGKPIGDPTKMVLNFKHGQVDIITPLGGPRAYADGSLIRSTTNAAMKCHTDGFGEGEIPEFLAMYAKRSDPLVQSKFAFVPEIISALDDAVINELKRSIFPSKASPRPILFPTEFGLGIRFDRFEIARLDTVTEKRKWVFQRSLIDHLAAVIDSSVFKIQIPDKHFVIFDNRRFLHGRTAISQVSDRILFRVRGNWTIGS